MHWTDKKALVWLQFIELVGWANVILLFMTRFPASSHLLRPPSSPDYFLLNFQCLVSRRDSKIVTGYWIGCYSSLHREVFFHRPLSMCCMPNLIDKWCLEREIVQGIKISWFIKSDCKTKWKSSQAHLSSLVQRWPRLCWVSHSFPVCPWEVSLGL